MEEWPVPGANEEYFLYQTLVGSWPLEPCSTEERSAFTQRIQAYMVKALHEAKVHTSWMNPNRPYDEAVQQFVARILDPATGQVFFGDFTAFCRRIAWLGMFNSLSQTLLKLTAPGIPVIYQRNGAWHF